MSEPSFDTKSEPALEPADLPDADRPERLFKKGKVSTPAGVDKVATHFGEQSIPILIQALSSISPKTREAAYVTLRGFGDVAFQQLLQTAIEGKGDQRLAAVTYLGEWGDPRAVDALVLAIKRDNAEQTRHNVGNVAGQIALATLLIGIMIILAAVFDCSGGCTGGCEGACFACDIADNVRLRFEVAKSLARLGSLHAVGALARLVQDKNLEVAKTAHTALMELLSKADSLQEGQADALGPGGLVELADLLSLNDYHLSRAILAVFRRVGDGRVLSAVEKLAQNLSRNRDLREGARELLPLLKERIAQQEVRATLLRAAEGNTIAVSDNLLRPASFQSATEPPQQLLRPTDHDA